MFQSDPLADKAGAILFTKVEQCWAAILAERGIEDPRQLPRALGLQLAERAMLEAAASISPTGNLEMLKHGFRSATHPAFFDAMDRIRVSCKYPADAFEMVRGIYAAVVLAGLGLPVAPFDLDAMRIKAKPSNDIASVQELFAADKGACVGYNTCDAPFYLPVTDCIRTLRQLVPVHPKLAELRKLFARGSIDLPPDPGKPFEHGMAIFNRGAGDAISTILLGDPDPSGGGSVILYAGWRVDGEPYGAPNDGYVPVPNQLLRAVVSDPRYAYPFWLSDTTSPTIH
jgi:hypothetical protein